MSQVLGTIRMKARNAEKNVHIRDAKNRPELRVYEYMLRCGNSTRRISRTSHRSIKWPQGIELNALSTSLDNTPKPHPELEPTFQRRRHYNIIGCLDGSLNPLDLGPFKRLLGLTFWMTGFLMRLSSLGTSVLLLILALAFLLSVRQSSLGAVMVEIILTSWRPLLSRHKPSAALGISLAV